MCLGSGRKMVLPIQPVASGNNDSQNTRCRAADSRIGCGSRASRGARGRPLESRVPPVPMTRTDVENRCSRSFKVVRPAEIRTYPSAAPGDPLRESR